MTTQETRDALHAMAGDGFQLNELVDAIMRNYDVVPKFRRQSGWCDCGHWITFHSMTGSCMGAKRTVQEREFGSITQCACHAFKSAQGGES